MTTASLVTFTDVAYTYPEQAFPALAIPNWQIAPGEFITLTGPSGSGKSTLLRCLNGLTPHFSGGAFGGVVMVDGQDTRYHTPRDLARRVQSVMGGRIKSSAELIARTEVHQAVQRGSLRAAQSMSIADSLTKEWVSGGDDRVRESHRDAHGQTVALDDDFDVGGATGPMPGNLGAAEEDINCRCTVRYRRDRRAVDSIKETQHDAVHAPATG